MPLSTPTRTLNLFSAAVWGLCALQAVGEAQRPFKTRQAAEAHLQRSQQRAQQGAQPASQPDAQQAAVAAQSAQRPGPAQAAVTAKGEHLAEWMNAHKNLTPAQQQQALQNEPGFRELPAQTQQRYRDRLAQLNAMNPQQRENTVRNIENIERLTPQQRGQVRGAMQQLGALPPEQRRIVARNFRQLRDLPPDQRAAALSRIPLNDEQRSALTNLMSVEPMLPPPEPAQPH